MITLKKANIVPLLALASASSQETTILIYYYSNMPYLPATGY